MAKMVRVRVNIANGLEKPKGATGATIPGSFSCMGAVNPKVLEKVRSMPKEKQPAWMSRAEEAVGHPDESDIKGLKDAVAEALKSL
jgi:hypothetical protein